jgi:hypothetical protein
VHAHDEGVFCLGPARVIEQGSEIGIDFQQPHRLGRLAAP